MIGISAWWKKARDVGSVEGVGGGITGSVIESNEAETNICEMSNLVKETEGGVRDGGKRLEVSSGGFEVEIATARFRSDIESGGVDTGTLGGTNAIEVPAGSFG